MIKKLLALLMLAAGLLLAAFSIRAYETGCIIAADERLFKATELLINVSAFPKGWKENSASKIPSSPLGGSAAVERYGVDFSSADVHAIQAVYRLPCEQRAVAEFENWRRREYLDTPSGRDWSVPPLGASWATYADQSYLACGKAGAEQRCMAIARYSEYFVEFYARMSPDTFTMVDLESALSTMDRQIGSKLR